MPRRLPLLRPCSPRAAGAVRALGVAATLVVLAAGALAAHDTWLAPTQWAVPAGADVTFDLTSGMAFPTLDHAVARGRTRRSAVRLGGAGVPLRPASAAAHSLRFRARLEHPGVATAFVELAPNRLALTDSLVAEYLDEIGASDEVRRRWAATPAPRRWREVYTKHATTYVRVGGEAAGGDSSWATPLGLGLEIVPQRDPTALRAGDTLAVRVLAAGAPLAGFVLNAVAEGDRAGTFHTTDADGRARVVVHRPGRWLLRGTRLRPSSAAGTDWESAFTTATLAVAAAPAR